MFRPKDKIWPAGQEMQQLTMLLAANGLLIQLPLKCRKKI